MKYSFYAFFTIYVVKNNLEYVWLFSDNNCMDCKQLKHINLNNRNLKL